MIGSMKIPKMLSSAFAIICAASAITMFAFIATIIMVRSSTNNSNLSQSIYSKALALETAVLRQNSQLRGYLVTADESYLMSYYEGRDEYDNVLSELKPLITDPDQRQLLEESRLATVAWRKDWGDRMIGVVRSGRREEAQQTVRDAGKKVLVSKAVLPLRDIREAQAKLIAQNGARQERAIATAMAALIVGGIALIVIAMTLSAMLSRMIAAPITTLTNAMTMLARGDNDIVVDAHRADELGDMARAVLVFRDTALAKAEAEIAKAEASKAKAEADAARASGDAAAIEVVKSLSAALERLAEGDLTVPIQTRFPASYEKLRNDYNRALKSLNDLVSDISSGVTSLREGARDISSAADQLAHRTEQQAASLEQTAAALNEITVTVRSTSTGAAMAKEAVDATNADVQRSGQTMTEAVTAMGRIETAARQMELIVGTIDELAFQTNLLALNAGVEAARAGDSGRGFAVVAQEVRALAQRSASAAKQIKILISDSNQQVSLGASLVNETGSALGKVVDQVSEISRLVSEIASSAVEQARGLDEVNTAVNHMDRFTQQNAAMVQESTSASHSIRAEADRLGGKVSVFKTTLMRNSSKIDAA